MHAHKTFEDDHMGRDRGACSESQDMIRRVLVADDERDIRNLLRVVLEEEGYEVVTSANGKEAIEFLMATHESWIVLLDVMMPYLSGLDVCGWLVHACPERSRHQVILMTASDLQEHECPSMVQSLLRKPFGISELVNLVDLLAENAL